MYQNQQPTFLEEEDKEKVELFIACRKLRDLDTLSKSDPQVRLFEQVKKGMGWKMWGKTETIKDNLNPNFSRSFIIDYIFECQQVFKLHVVDIDDFNNDSKFDTLGEAQFEQGEQMGSKNNMLILDLLDPKQKNSKKSMGKIIIRSETVAKLNDYITMSFGCKNLQFNNLCCGPGKPFMTISKARMNSTQIRQMKEKKISLRPQIGVQYSKNILNNSIVPANNEMLINDLNVEWLKVYQTEVYHQASTDPRFKKFLITASKLCTGSYDTPLKFEFWQHSSSGTHVYKGETILTVNEIRKNTELGFSFEMWNKFKKNKGAGQFSIDLFKTEPNYTFPEFLKGGINISTIVCIDFTQSNLPPNDSNSLHFMRPGQMNEYQQAIIGITQIQLNYDKSKRIKTFGFGGAPKFPRPQIDTNNKCCHFFPCSGDPSKTEGDGINGVFKQYNFALQHTRQSGPTLFNPLLTEIGKFTEEKQRNDPDNYIIQLILTDGIIHDMADTIDTIVELSVLPLSVIIIGVGKDNFDKMVDLDSDDALLRGTYGTAKRDIVQFVPYRDFKNDPTRLAQEVLAEVPEQITSYFRSIKRPPNKPKQINESMIDNAINHNAPIRRTGTIEDFSYQPRRQQTIPIAQPNIDLVQQTDYQYPSHAKPIQIYSSETIENPNFTNPMTRNQSEDRLINKMQPAFPHSQQNLQNQTMYQQVDVEQGYNPVTTAYQPPIHNNIQGIPIGGIDNIDVSDNGPSIKKKKKSNK